MTYASEGLEASPQGPRQVCAFKVAARCRSAASRHRPEMGRCSRPYLAVETIGAVSSGFASLVNSLNSGNSEDALQEWDYGIDQ